MVSELTPYTSLSEWERRIEQIHQWEKPKRTFAAVRFFARDLLLHRVAPKIVLVGGTNGKGSVVHFAEQMLLEQGYSVGCTYSPHLQKINERVCVNGMHVSNRQLTEAFSVIFKDKTRPPLTYFDILTLSALFIFKTYELDIVLLEVGLGGRLDASNVVEPDVSVITNVSLDHQEILGVDREAIGYEKAGILRSRTPVVLGEVDIPSTVLRLATQLHCPIEYPDEVQAFRTPYHLPTMGTGVCHPSRINSAIALQIVRSLHLEKRTVDVPTSTLQQLPGRQELIELEGCRWLLDVSHNRAGILYLANYIAEKFQHFTITTIFACRREKDFEGMLEIVTKFSDRTIITGTHGDHLLALSDSDANVEPAVSFVRHTHLVFKQLQGNISDTRLYVVCGSFKLVAEMRDLLHRSKTKPRDSR